MPICTCLAFRVYWLSSPSRKLDTGFARWPYCYFNLEERCGKKKKPPILESVTTSKGSIVVHSTCDITDMISFFIYIFICVLFNDAVDT
jgi:hypothetical protein